MFLCYTLVVIGPTKARGLLQHSKKFKDSNFAQNEIQYVFLHDVQWSCFSSNSKFNCCGIGPIFCSKSGPSLAFGYCATFDGHMLSIATCRYYFERSRYNVTTSGHIPLPISLNDLNESMCAPLNRKGYVCSACKDGFGLSVTSFGYKCINCTAHWYSVPLFLLLEFVPVTVSYLLILSFQISITSPPMPCFIMFAQFFIYITDYHHLWTGIVYDDNGELTLSYKVFRAFYGLFNLDFFRHLPLSLCLSNWLKPIHIAFFHYITAFYPLFLIFLTWILVNLHDRNVQLLVCLWRPFHKCFVRLRKRWDSKSDLIDVFITFFILSYYKFVYRISISFTGKIILEVDLSGNVSSIYQAEIDPKVAHNNITYLSLLILSGIVVSTCIVLPPLLLILYPIRMFRSCLSKCRLKSLTITIFTDKIQSCYRNGLDGGRDMRSFSAFYFYLRISFHVIPMIFARTLKTNAWTCLGITFSLSALIIALIRPYRKTYMNINDTLLLVIISLLCFSKFNRFVTTLLLLSSPVVGLVILLFILRFHYLKKLLLQFILKTKEALSKICRDVKTRLRDTCLTLSGIKKNYYSEHSERLPILDH